MPQLQFGDFAPQLIWLAITFITLYFALSRVAIPRVEHVLGERKARVDGDLEKARTSQRQAEEEMIRYDAQIAAAKARGQALARARREKLEAELAQRRGVLDKETASKVANAEENIRNFMEQASTQMEGATSEAVTDIVRQFAGVEVSGGEVAAALRQATKG